MLGDFLFEDIPAIVVHQLDVHPREVALQVFLDGGGAFLLDGLVGGILVVVGGDVGDEFHAVDLVLREVGVFLVEVESGGGIVGLLGLVGEGEHHIAVLGGDGPLAGALDAGLVLHEVDLLGIVGAFALDVFGHDGAADAVALFQHQHDEVHAFAVIDFGGQVADFGDELAGFEVGVLVDGHQFLEGDGFGDRAAVPEVVVHLVVVALVLAFLHDVDGDGVALLADEAFDFLVVVGGEIDLAVLVDADAFGEDFQRGFGGALLADLVVIAFQVGLAFGVGDVLLAVAGLVVVEGAVVAQDEGDVHALHRGVGVVAEAHIGVAFGEHHVGGLHVLEDGLHEGEAEVVVAVFGFAHIGFGLGHELVAVACEAILAQAVVGGLVGGVVLQGLLILRSLIVSLELCCGVEADVMFQLGEIAVLGACEVHHIGETLVENLLVVVVGREIPHIFGIFFQRHRIELAILVFRLGVGEDTEYQQYRKNRKGIFSIHKR